MLTSCTALRRQQERSLSPTESDEMNVKRIGRYLKGVPISCKSTNGRVAQWRSGASKRGLGRMKHVLLKYMFVQDVVEKKQTTLSCVNTVSNKADLMTKCHTFEAHMKLASSSHSDVRSGQRCLDLIRRVQRVTNVFSYKLHGFE